MKNKVFCKDCKYYFRTGGPLGGVKEGCLHSSNWKDTWYRPQDKELLHPSEKNSMNNCNYFKKEKNFLKRWLFK